MNIPGRLIRNGEAVYSEWVPREGDGLIIRAEIIDKNLPSTAMDLDITVFTKNDQDSGAGTDAGSGGTSWTLALNQATPAGTTNEALFESDSGGSPTVGLKELIRYKVEASNGGNSDWFRVRVFPPIFFDQSRAP